jgi:hypothetical protein
MASEVYRHGIDARVTHGRIQLSLQDFASKFRMSDLRVDSRNAHVAPAASVKNVVHGRQVSRGDPIQMRDEGNVGPLCERVDDQGCIYGFA